MNEGTQKDSSKVLANLDSLLGDLESVYKDLHAHPELSMQENRTASIATDRLRAAGYEVTTGVGKAGVVGLLRNGDGPTIMLRADIDALPVKEATGCCPKPATSLRLTVRENRACDARMRSRHARDLAVGATTLFAQTRDAWRGTLMPVFQPAERRRRVPRR